MKIRTLLCLSLFYFTTQITAQIPDSCKLEIGTNLGGLADYGTEIAFVDLMRYSRVWYTKSVDDPNDPFNSELAYQIELRPDGYPTHIPQAVDNSAYMQQVATIWGKTDGWAVGTYTILWEGEGELAFSGTHQNLQQTDTHRVLFDIVNPFEGSFEIRIRRSELNDPIHNIRVLMPGTEDTYETQPFNPVWIEKVTIFNTVRFMDWGSTNGWGVVNNDFLRDSVLVDWEARSQMDYYTWTHNKGVPYEMMVKYMNDYDKDGWVCVPHTASEEYIRAMAQYFRDNLEPERHIYVEYSNEIWNWIFPQTHWANEYGCIIPEVLWPEGTAPYIQKMLDYWTDEFSGEMDRTTRVVGIFTGWLDVAQRVAFNLDENTFDAISPTYYFHFSESLESELDDLGANATVEHVVDFARQSMQENFDVIEDVKIHLADVINKPLAFYEGGQHLTPLPFGVNPSYEDALVDTQRDTAMYNLYNEWFNKIRTLQEGDDPLLLMNFSFIAPLNAQYGSWGLLETMDQDVDVVPAPKYRAVIENMNTNCAQMPNTQSEALVEGIVRVFPNPTDGSFELSAPPGQYELVVFDANGRLVKYLETAVNTKIDISTFPEGIYFIAVQSKMTGELSYHKIVKQ